MVGLVIIIALLWLYAAVATVYAIRFRRERDAAEASLADVNDQLERFINR